MKLVKFSQIYKLLPKDRISFQISWMQNFGTHSSTEQEEKITITCSKKQLCAKHVDGYLFGLSEMLVQKVTIIDGNLGIVLWSKNHPFFHINGFEEAGCRDILNNSDKILKLRDLFDNEALDNKYPLVVISHNPSSVSIRNEFLSSKVAMLPYSNYNYIVTSIKIGSLEDPIKLSASTIREAIAICAKYPPLVLKGNKND